MLVNSPSIPLSLYIHMPWCIRKCPYCDFNSHALKNKLPEEQYIQQLLLDLDHDLQWVQSRKLKSIFFGGGTPSLFSPKWLDNLLKQIQAKIDFEDNIEITLEANPGTVEQLRFESYRQAGINRLSIGCQSFNADKLKVLGRIHGQEEAIRAAESACKAGFDNFNLDVMFALPNQTIEEALEDIQVAISLNPTHISWYQLTLEPNTLFHHQPPPLPDDDISWQMQRDGIKLLANNGYGQYEVSAYAKDNKQCQHNLNYWQFGDYLGIGAGAHSKLTDWDNKVIKRFSKFKHPKQYLNIEDDFIAEARVLDSNDKIFEYMLNHLRLNKDIKLEEFSKFTFLDSHVLDDYISIAIEKELLVKNNDYLKKTELGQKFLNDLQEVFLDN